ncbi:MAG: DUF1573 domain-containing protein [Lentimicrobiaceae bacterium]|nr:DUF1573 domain-containing protein [Lentimicrobiaceae bacterium]
MSKKIYYVLLLAVLVFITGCREKDSKTTLKITDNYRHYYPIITGQELDIMFELENTGENPFRLKDIVTSCGCITLKKSSIRVISPGKKGLLRMTYDSRKNIGYVKHYITLYGNFTTTDKIDIVFDVNVVPDAHYTRDYEELYLEKIKEQGGFKRFVEGDANRKGYYMTTEKDIILE